MQELEIYLLSTMQYASFPTASVQVNTPSAASPSRTISCASYGCPSHLRRQESGNVRPSAHRRPKTHIAAKATARDAEHGTKPIGTIVIGSAHPPPAIASAKNSTGVFPVCVASCFSLWGCVSKVTNKTCNLRVLERHGGLDRSEDGFLRAQSHRVAACVGRPNAVSVEQFFKTHKHKVREGQDLGLLGPRRQQPPEKSPYLIQVDDIAGESEDGMLLGSNAFETGSVRSQKKNGVRPKGYAQ